MLQVRNSTPFVADLALLADHRGVECAIPILKGTFSVDETIEITDRQWQIGKQDEYRGAATNSGLAQVGEFHLPKPGTDVIVQGDCISANGVELDQCDVNVEVAQLNKRLRIFGDRYWDGQSISSAQRFSRMPLVYERAFGGGQEQDIYEQNPIGVGYVSETGQPLPNIELPEQLISTKQCRPHPAGVEAIPPAWIQRRCFAGTYDEDWERLRAPFLPTDFDLRFFCAASDGLTSEKVFAGGEQVCITNMSMQPKWEFQLPIVEVECIACWRGQMVNIPLLLDTLHLMPNEAQFSLTWRGYFPVNQWASRFEFAEFFLKSFK